VTLVPLAQSRSILRFEKNTANAGDALHGLQCR
jgi:hypothetical protein